MSPDERRALIARYAEGVRAVERALEGFPEPLLTERPFPGKWTAREIVHHLGDSETTAAIRIRKLLTEDAAEIQGYDQDLYAVRLRYNGRDHDAAMRAFRAARENTLPLLEAMSDDDWEREGTHSESGRYTAERWLEIYAAHAHGHADQIRRLRDALVKG